MKPYDTPHTRASWSESLQLKRILGPNAFFETDASMFQYPYWNESFVACASVLIIWYMALRPRRRPMCVSLSQVSRVSRRTYSAWAGALAPGVLLDPEWVRDIREWARQKRCIFLRFTHSDETILRTLSSGGACQGVDPFPLYGDPAEELTVELREDGIVACFIFTDRPQASAESVA